MLDCLLCGPVRGIGGHNVQALPKRKQKERSKGLKKERNLEGQKEKQTGTW